MTRTAQTAAEAYQHYGPALVRKAERLLRNSDDAMDVVQSLFVDLIARPPTSLELSYLYSAVTNRCLNLIRNQSNRSRLLSECDDSLRGPTRSAPETAMVSLDLTVRLIDALDARSAELVVYHFVDDLSQEEVAEQMGISRRAVVKRLAKIRMLARSLARAASEGGDGAGPAGHTDLGERL